MANVPYIRSGGRFLVAHPFAIRGVTGYGFAVRGDIDKITALCDATLNHGGDTVYRVLSRTVVITFIRMDRMSSMVEPDKDHGTCSETELNITILLAAGRKIGGVFIPERLVWHMPYLWVDCSSPMIAGREIYGFPKQYGTVQMPLGMGDAAAFRLDAEVIHTYSPQSSASAQKVASAERQGGGRIEHASVWATLENATSDFVSTVIEIDHPVVFAGTSLANLAATHLFDLVFLRQFPSITDSSRACFQQVLEAAFTPTLHAGGYLAGDYDLEIVNHDSAPICTDFGFPAPDGVAHLKPHAAFFVNLDFDLLAPREIWAAP
jgi:hypothetical protein